jgi:cytochrome c oxidase subunit I+III
MVFPIFAALYYWMPVITGRRMSERLGRWAFALIFVGFNAAFLPMHLTGLRGMPRRVYTYDATLGLNWLNLISTVGAFVLAAGVLMFLVDFIRHLRRGQAAGDNPWNAPSLEWLSSNSPVGFRSLPNIDSRYPMWDHKDLKPWVMEGRGYLPDAPTLARESLVTSPITGEPERIIRLPGSSWIPFFAALATAIFFVALTLKSLPVAAGSGAIAFAFLLSWMWKLDQAYPRDLADAGHGLALPLYRNDRESFGWWAMMVVLIADASLTLSLAFAYLFLWTAHPTAWPPDGSQIPGLIVPALLFALVAAAGVCFEGAERFNQRDRRLATSVCFIAAAILGVAALLIGWTWPLSLSIDPTRHSYGAAVWTLLGWVGVHVAVGAAMALWCLVRQALGMLDSWRCLTLRICLLWWRFTVLATTLVLLLVTGFPYALR